MAETPRPAPAGARAVLPIVAATFLTLVPVTLPLPGLAELVMEAHGGGRADRVGWFAPLVAGTIGFGLVYAGYGALSPAALPVLMVLSGVLSALMYAPNVVLVGEMVRRGAGEGLFGAFQVAGSCGFLAGPVVGGLLVELSQDQSGAVAYAPIFAAVGALVVTLGVMAALVLRPLARAWRYGVEQATA